MVSPPRIPSSTTAWISKRGSVSPEDLRWCSQDKSGGIMFVLNQGGSAGLPKGAPGVTKVSLMLQQGHQLKKPGWPTVTEATPPIVTANAPPLHSGSLHPHTCLQSLCLICPLMYPNADSWTRHLTWAQKLSLEGTRVEDDIKWPLSQPGPFATLNTQAAAVNSHSQFTWSQVRHCYHPQYIQEGIYEVRSRNQKLGETPGEVTILRLKSALYWKNMKKNPVVESPVNISVDENKLFLD